MEITDLPNLASAQLGTRIVFATDDWFAAAGKKLICLAVREMKHSK
jgi:allantoicase